MAKLRFPWLLAVAVMGAWLLAVLLWTPAASRGSGSGLPYDWPAAADVDDGGCRCLRLESASGVMTEAARERMWAAYRLSDAHAAPDATQLSTRGPLRDRDALMKPVLAELRRSIRAFRRDRVTAAADAAELLRRAVGDVWVLVFDNRVYVAEGFVNHVKREGHATMVKAAADLVGLPNALYAVSTATSGANGCGEGEPLRLAVNKQVGYDQCGVLIPNTYFGKGNLTEWARECTATAPPFGARRPVALYRGSLHLRNQTEDQNTCARAEYGNYARLASFAASLEAPDRVDSKRTGQHPDPAKALAPPPVCAAFAPATGLKPGTPIHGAYLGDEEYRRHKYLLNLPGALKGSYSRNLNKLWRDGSVVLQWVAPYVEWYYPALRDRVTHVAVGRRSVADTVRALEANPAAAAAIGAAGKEIHDTFLCPLCLAGFLKATLEALRDHLGLGLVLDDRAAASAFFRAHVPCDRVVEVVDYAVEGDKKSYPMRALAPDDPAHPCRGGGPAPNAGWGRDHEWALRRLGRVAA